MDRVLPTLGRRKNVFSKCEPTAKRLGTRTEWGLLSSNGKQILGGRVKTEVTHWPVHQNPPETHLGETALVVQDPQDPMRFLGNEIDAWLVVVEGDFPPLDLLHDVLLLGTEQRRGGRWPPSVEGTCTASSFPPGGSWEILASPAPP